MSAASISKFDWRLVNQQRQIYDCVFRLFDSSKYISRCQKATTLILITFYDPLFHLWKSSEKKMALPYFCLGCLLKSAIMTSFSQLRLSRNSCSGRSLDKINVHFLALYTRWLIEKGEECEKLSRFLYEWKNFTFREMHVGENSMGKS